jgi:hypothetical protein
VVSTFQNYSLGNLQIYSILTLTIVTLLYKKSPELIKIFFEKIVLDTESSATAKIALFLLWEVTCHTL